MKLDINYQIYGMRLWRVRMIKVEHIDAWGFGHAIRGMRNPMNSWDKRDSYDCCNYFDEECVDCKHNYVACSHFYVGDNDLKLMQRLYKAGTEHRKYLRQIFVSMDITAPLYWWKEFDTYKVGTVANSCSTMHKIAAKEFELDDFSHEHLESAGLMTLKGVISRLNLARDYYIGEYDNINSQIDKKSYWWEMIQLLPSSYNQKRTITMNYENVVNMIKQRSNHKLDEWREFVNILKELPYVMEIQYQ